MTNSDTRIDGNLLTKGSLLRLAKSKRAVTVEISDCDAHRLIAQDPTGWGYAEIRFSDKRGRGVVNCSPIRPVWYRDRRVFELTGTITDVQAATA